MAVCSQQSFHTCTSVPINKIDADPVSLTWCRCTLIHVYDSRGFKTLQFIICKHTFSTTEAYIIFIKYWRLVGCYIAGSFGVSLFVDLGCPSDLRKCSDCFFDNWVTNHLIYLSVTCKRQMSPCHFCFDSCFHSDFFRVFSRNLYTFVARASEAKNILQALH